MRHFARPNDLYVGFNIRFVGTSSSLRFGGLFKYICFPDGVFCIEQYFVSAAAYSVLQTGSV